MDNRRDVFTDIIKRLLISLFIIVIIRFGGFLALPIIDQKAVNFYIQTSSVPQDIIHSFSNKGPLLISFFTLNIFPYINATIFAQLLFWISPSLSKLRKEGSLASRRQLTQKTRELTVIWAFLQGISISLCFYKLSMISNLNWNFLLFIEVSIWLATGAMVVLFLSDIITDYGLGNGPALFVCINIVSNFPNLYQKLITGDFRNLTVFSQFSFINLFFLMIIMIICLQLGETRVDIMSSTQLKKSKLNISKLDISKLDLFKLDLSELKPEDFYIPFRLNQIGVMPIIFTTTVLGLPNKIIETINFLPIFFSQSIYWLIYFVVLLQFSYFYSNISLSPIDVSDQLRQMTSIVLGIRPGIQTLFYLVNLRKRSMIITAFLLSILSAFPEIMRALFNISDVAALNAVSFIIIVGVLSDVNRETKDIIETK